VLITGSGPQDRDETVAGHRPFLVLADHLTRHGVAVLRYDDRGFGESSGNFASATSNDFAADVLAAVAYLKTRNDIDAKRIGLMGHSEGGLVAPIVAAHSRDVAFVVLLAGPGVKGIDILLLQAEKIARAGGTPDRLIQLNQKAQRSLFAVAQEEQDTAVAARRMRAVMQMFIDSLTAEDRRTLGFTDAASNSLIETMVRQVNGPWFRYFLDYDPRGNLEHVTVPVLALNGEKDLQVPHEQNLPTIEAALRAGGNQDITIRLLPGLNHLFQTAKTGSPSEYAGIEETFAPAALDVISSWITQRFGTAR
jgi:pimeloyl-ACP methyl ester carboxylesterase